VLVPREPTPEVIELLANPPTTENLEAPEWYECWWEMLLRAAAPAQNAGDAEVAPRATDGHVSATSTRSEHASASPAPTEFEK